jgi:hypothetical protein
MVLTRFVELVGAATLFSCLPWGSLRSLHAAPSYSCSRTEAVAAVAARMSQDFPGYLSYKLHASLPISVEAEYKLRGQSDQTRNFRVFAVAGWHPGVSITFFTFVEVKFPATIVYISAPGGRSCSCHPLAIPAAVHYM